MNRKPTKEVKIGSLTIGGQQPIAIQSMLNMPVSDLRGNIEQAKRLQKAGCEIIRIAIPNADCIPLILALKEEVNVPLVADIHFDHRLALSAMEAGVDKIRINPGNIPNKEGIAQVARMARQKKVPIRIGVNSGSVEKPILEKYGMTSEALVKSALYHVSLLEEQDFSDIVISLKASNVQMMIDAYTQMSECCSYPLHLGVTEAGGLRAGIIKSAVGIGKLLLDGIGDTIRISLTADPVEEVYAAKDLLRSLGLYHKGIEFIACPTCGRTKISLIPILNQLENALQNCEKNLKVAVMGCAVNGPGEAREADIGIAGGDGCALIFKKGEIIRKIPESEIISQLVEEIQRM